MQAAAENTVTEIIQEIESLKKQAKEGNTAALNELASLLQNSMKALKLPQKKEAA